MKHGSVLRKPTHRIAVCAVLIGLTGKATIAAEKTTTIVQSTHSYSVGLGATRIIYDPSLKGATVSINNPNDYPVLVQSVAWSEDKTSKAPFIVTPPLFRLDPKRQSHVRMVMTQEPKVKDKESLYWLCVTGIPPVKGDAWADEKNAKKDVATVDVKIKMARCIKLFVRPSGLEGTSQGAASSLTWKQVGDKLTGTNPSPFYVNIESLSIGGQKIDLPSYISPLSSKTYTVPKGATGNISWKTINDLGGSSGPYEKGGH